MHADARGRRKRRQKRREPELFIRAPARVDVAGEPATILLLGLLGFLLFALLGVVSFGHGNTPSLESAEARSRDARRGRISKDKYNDGCAGRHGKTARGARNFCGTETKGTSRGDGPA